MIQASFKDMQKLLHNKAQDLDWFKKYFFTKVVGRPRYYLNMKVTITTPLCQNCQI